MTISSMTVMSHPDGCVRDGRCWIDGDGTEWHPGNYVGVYSVRDIPQPPSKKVGRFFRNGEAPHPVDVKEN